MKTPTFDANGYPSEETLDALEKWNIQDSNTGLDFMAAAWKYPEMVSRHANAAELLVLHAEPDEKFLRLATGGWSGNEDLIDAWKSGVAGMITWRLSSRGGLHIFQYLSLKEDK